MSTEIENIINDFVNVRHKINHQPINAISISDLSAFINLLVKCIEIMKNLIEKTKIEKKD